MKCCPRCQKIFKDEVVYCLDDGTTLYSKPDPIENTSPVRKIKLDEEAMALFSRKLCPKCQSSNNWRRSGDKHTCLNCGESFLQQDGWLFSLPERPEPEKQRETIESSPIFSIFGKMFGWRFRNPEKYREERSKHGKLILLGSYMFFAFIIEMKVGLYPTIMGGILAIYFHLSPKNTETPRVWIGAFIAILLFAYAGPDVFNVSRIKERLGTIRGDTGSGTFEEIADGSGRNLTGITEVWLLNFSFDNLGEIGPEIQHSGLNKKMMNAAIETVLDETGIKILPTAQTDMVVHLWIRGEADMVGVFGYTLSLELTAPSHVDKQVMLWRRELQGTVKQKNLKERTMTDLQYILGRFADDYLQANPR